MPGDAVFGGVEGRLPRREPGPARVPAPPRRSRATGRRTCHSGYGDYTDDPYDSFRAVPR
jgi:guanyl-specific ribonuclease Sa